MFVGSFFNSTLALELLLSECIMIMNTYEVGCTV